ncbi:MAG: ferrous iron transport protein B [Clostridia bacterium]|nr:ferrous iron transport protein B [Clostridia bacterium]
MLKDIKIAFVGNPNCGKTTLFNSYTGANLKTANWPGVTVDVMSGKAKLNGRTFVLTDLPGTYALSSFSEDEKVTADYLFSRDDVIINVVDASNLERNLCLTLQLLIHGKTMVLALNMMDIVKKRGMEIDISRLEELLGIRVIPVSAKKRTGLSELLKATESAKKPQPEIPITKNTEEIYRLIEKIIKEVAISGKKAEFTSKIDKILTHNFWGLPVFFIIMAVVFFLTFTLGDYLKLFFENWLESFIKGTTDLLVSKSIHTMLISLITEGIIPGVGGVLTFLPNITILFLALAFLEDSGYMSSVSYIMDKIMSKAGLSGKAFIPMILGFGCSVPAILATRTLENRKDRIKTIFAVPYMSCSAKLPVYVMLSKLFFEKYEILVAYSMYVIGFLVAILMLLVISKKEKKESNLLIEFPEYRMPDTRTVAIYVWEKVKEYLTKAGTTIFLASVVLWLLLHIGKGGLTNNVAESIGAKMGEILVPIMKPTGLGYWQIIVSLIWGIAAKEAVVSGISVLYGISNISSPVGMGSLLKTLTQSGFGALNAYSMMLFCLLYTPCIASIITASKEIKSRIITLIALAVQLVIAWSVSLIFYQIGRMII